MFEQAAVTSPTRKRWSIAVSLSGELLLIWIAIVTAPVYTAALPRLNGRPATLSAPPSRTARPPRAAVREHRLTAVSVEAKPATFIPTTRVSEIQRLPRQAEIIDSPLPDGAPDGTGLNSADAMALLSQLSARPAVPPAAAKPLHPGLSRSVTEPVRVSVSLQTAKLIVKVIPIYPAPARAAHISGVVRLAGVIGKDGRIQNLQVLSGNPLLTRAAVEAVMQWVYQPTLLHGEPVEVVAPIMVSFILNE